MEKAKQNGSVIIILLFTTECWHNNYRVTLCMSAGDRDNGIKIALVEFTGLFCLYEHLRSSLHAVYVGVTKIVSIIISNKIMHL